MLVRPLLALALAAVVAGCAEQEAPAPPAPPRAQDGVSVVEPGNPCVPEPAVQGTLPADYPSLAFPPGTVVTYVDEQPGSQTVSGRVEGDAAGVLQHFRSTAEAAGFAVIRDEDEGRAGRLQLFGATSEVGIAVAKLTCPAGSAGFTISVRRTVS